VTAINQQVNVQINAEVINLGQIEQFNKVINETSTNTTTFAQNAVRTGNSARQASAGLRVMERAQRQLNTAVKAFITFEVSRFISTIIRDALGAQNALEKLDDQFVSLAGGNVFQAANEFARLEMIAADLPGTFQDIANASNQLGVLGLDNSAASLETFLDLAAGFGRDVPQLVNAVADAANFEFERLKEAFGIVGRQEADSIILTFRGVEIEVEKSSEAVVDAILEIGRTNFDGTAVATQVDNLAINWAKFNSQLALTIRESSIVQGTLKGLSGLLLSINDNNALLGGNAGENILERQLQNTIDRIEEIEALRGTLDFSFPFQINDRGNTRVIFAGGEAALEVLRENARQYRAEIRLIQSDVGNFVSIDQRIATGLAETNRKIAEATAETDAAYEKLLTNINRQTATLEVGRFESQIAELDGLSEAQRRALDTAVNNLRSLESTRELTRDANRLIQGLGDTVLTVNQSYEETLALIDRAARANVIDRDLLPRIDAQAAEDFRNDLRDLIGPQVFEDGTSETLAAINRRNEQIRQAFELGGEAAKVAQQVIINDQESVNQQLRDAINGLTGGDSAFLRVEQQIVAERRLVQSLGERVTDDILADFERLRNLRVDRLISNEQFTFGGDNVIEQLQEYREFLDNLGRQEFIRDPERAASVGIALQSIFDGLVGGGGSDNLAGLDQAQAALEARAAFLRELEASGTGNQDEVLAAQRDNAAASIQIEQDRINAFIELGRQGNIQALDFERATNAERAALAAGAVSTITEAWSENSRTIFEINQALNLAMAISNFSTGLTKAFALGGVPGFLSGLAATGSLLAVINDIRNTEFGQNSVNSSAGGGAGGLSGSIDQFGGAGSGALNINVFVEGSILDTGGFNDAIVNGVQTAINNDQLQLNPIRFRRR
jgi:hypothetical protein